MFSVPSNTLKTINVSKNREKHLKRLLRKALGEKTHFCYLCFYTQLKIQGEKIILMGKEV